MSLLDAHVGQCNLQSALYTHCVHQVSTLQAWAEEKGLTQEGGGKGGRFPLKPVKVGLVAEEDWASSGMSRECEDKQGEPADLPFLEVMRHTRYRDTVPQHACSLVGCPPEGGLIVRSTVGTLDVPTSSPLRAPAAAFVIADNCAVASATKGIITAQAIAF